MKNKNCKNISRNDRKHEVIKQISTAKLDSPKKKLFFETYK